MEQWPQILNSEHVTRLILLQQLYRLGLVDYSPLDDPEFVAAAGGEGVELPAGGDGSTGQSHQKIFLLERLKQLEIYKIELRLLSRFERTALVRVEEIVETNRVRRNKLKARWNNRRNHERARWRVAARKRKEKRLMKEKEEKEEVTANIGDEKEASGDQVEVRNLKMVGIPEVVTGAEQPPRTIESSRPEVELEVVRVGPNPRVVQCRYRLLADEIRIHLWVKTNKNFKRGMKVRMWEQAGEDWRFEGVLPRHAGRW